MELIVVTECLSEHMTALKTFLYQLVTVSLRLLAEVLGLGLDASAAQNDVSSSALAMVWGIGYRLRPSVEA
jgi:hypothetical protein